MPYSIGNNDVLAQLAKKLYEHMDFLTRLLSPPASDGNEEGSRRERMTEPHRLDILDVLANAMRRGEIEHRYDDAVARLYAAIEAIARYRLSDIYGIDNSGALPGQIPEDLREEYVQRYGGGDTGDPLRFGLWPSYLLLTSLGDEVGTRFADSKQDFESLLRGTEAMHTEPVPAWVVESYTGPDDVTIDTPGGVERITKGSWALVIKWPPDVWERIASGDLTTYSTGGVELSRPLE